jgi:hypothetical protein
MNIWLKYHGIVDIGMEDQGAYGMFAVVRYEAAANVASGFI